MKQTETKQGMKVRSVKHPEDLGTVIEVLFAGKAAMVRWNDDAETHVALASLLRPANH